MTTARRERAHRLQEHRQCIDWMTLLVEAGYENALALPGDPEWLSARWLLELRERAKPEDKHLFDRVVSDTPPSRIFMELFDRYLPLLRG